MLLFIKIGFLEVAFWDIIDIIIVAYLLFSLLRLIKGSISLNIMGAVSLLYAMWWTVDWLRMDMLSMILGQFARLGLLALIIVFQPEMRRFLLLIGQTLDARLREFGQLFRPPANISPETRLMIEQLVQTLPTLAQHRTGALLVLTSNTELQVFSQASVRLDAHLSPELLLAIFNPESPLHDGAVILGKESIFAASSVLPVSENPDLPQYIGTRHRAAVGVTEVTDAIAIVVSEETGALSYARDGKLYYDLTADEIGDVLLKAATQMV